MDEEMDKSIGALKRAVNCSIEKAATFAPLFDLIFPKYYINTPQRIAAFLGQTAHESLRFNRLQEALYYSEPERLVAVWPAHFRMPNTGEEKLDQFTDGKRNPNNYIKHPIKLANYVYADRNGNYGEASGDGYKFRARGLIGITGRNIYEAYEKASGVMVTAAPDLVCEPHWAADTAAWYWATTGCNDLADQGNWSTLTQHINGGLLGLQERVAITESVLAVYTGA